MVLKCGLYDFFSVKFVIFRVVYDAALRNPVPLFVLVLLRWIFLGDLNTRIPQRALSLHLVEKTSTYYTPLDRSFRDESIEHWYEGFRAPGTSENRFKDAFFFFSVNLIPQRALSRHLVEKTSTYYIPLDRFFRDESIERWYEGFRAPGPSENRFKDAFFFSFP